MHIDFFKKVFDEYGEKDAVVHSGKVYSYNSLSERILYWENEIKSRDIQPGTVVFIEADFSPNSIALFLALTDIVCIIVPITGATAPKKDEFIEIAQGELLIKIESDESVKFEKLDHKADHEYYSELREKNEPGLVVFSSGSSGKSKGMVLNLKDVMEKFKHRRRGLRAISFLLFDHFGGVNTMFHILSNGGCLVTVADRTPDGVLQAVEDFKVELLPTSPTFINLIFLNEAYKRHDISSLQVVSYGTEPMPESTLKRFHSLYPNIKLQQTYGLSETGVMRSKSKSSDSLWVKLGGEGFETRIVDGMLEIKSQSAMLGYLNAPDPYTADGWFRTMDLVETDGEYMRILGRKSEIINVGGEKVYPAEVENTIQELDIIGEVLVYPEKNPIVGNIVCAEVTIKDKNIDKKEIKKLVKKHCASKLRSYKVPVKIKVLDEMGINARFKKKRKV
ncbi:MAG: fatty acid--CoA ligase family protein [Candidatus Kapabacteria bacterium]|jgi:long-chain acyl-CoA synthetase|nr:fatty acid--CoA ligase family protein [Candidatus Kapabacteria bacterium]